MARRDGELVAGITAFADGPDEMREVIRHHVDIGVDNIKLSMSGEEVSRRIESSLYRSIDQVPQITEIRSAQDCYFTDEETAACVDEAHKHGKRLCAHARARDSVKMCMYPQSLCQDNVANSRTRHPTWCRSHIPRFIHR